MAKLSSHFSFTLLQKLVDKKSLNKKAEEEEITFTIFFNALAFPQGNRIQSIRNKPET